ncbi:hypothetical protein [Sciscionella marina]|uniref:hypothetical protein n=1 Tax=Sciscionella marina TaxID=508770 RepID=UPI000360502A|nr:hypothetical protein [Sciscionella marina]
MGDHEGRNVFVSGLAPPRFELVRLAGGQPPDGVRRLSRLELAKGLSPEPTPRAYDEAASFERFRCPSMPPGTVQTTLIAIPRTGIDQIGSESVTFDIEYLWGRNDNAISLVEITPRHSQTRTKVYRQGRFSVAVKWFVRRLADSAVSPAHTDREKESVEQENELHAEYRQCLDQSPFEIDEQEAAICAR